MVASAGYASASSVVEVTLSSVMFSDYATAITRDVTSAWVTSGCQTTAYPFYSSYLKSSCAFTTVAPPVSLLAHTAVCQGFVTSVDYLITHSTTSFGVISTVSAAVTITDVPVFVGTPKVGFFEDSYDGFSPGNFAGYSKEIPSVSVTQSFSATFTSVDTTLASNVNGNIVAR